MSTDHEEYTTLFLVSDDRIVPRRARVVRHQWQRQVAPLTRYEGAFGVSESLPTPDWEALAASRARVGTLEEPTADPGPEAVIACDCDEDGVPLTWEGPFYDSYGNFYPTPDLIQYNQANPDGQQMVPWSGRYGQRR